MAKRRTTKKNKPTRADIRLSAAELVKHYSAITLVSDNAKVRRGTLKHLDPKLEPTEGWYVDCTVFVPDDTDDGE